MYYMRPVYEKQKRGHAISGAKKKVYDNGQNIEVVFLTCYFSEIMIFF